MTNRVRPLSQGRILDRTLRIALVALVLSGAGCRPSDPIGADASKAPSSSAKASASEPARTASAAPSVPSAPPAVSIGSAIPSGSASAKAMPKSSSSGFGGLGLSGVGEGGGCPCGCDHSEDMVDELRAEPSETASSAIDDALRTIGEREDGGYITERMVQHRLRLLVLGKELGRTGPARFTAVAPIQANASGETHAGTKARAELFVHGETTEVVHGKEKLLRASFVVRLELENPRAADVTLREPTIDAKVGFPVSRWYVAGGEGRPWDGVLRAGEKKLVHVIGYAREAVQPGNPIDALVHVESLSLPTKARARKRWDRPD